MVVPPELPPTRRKAPRRDEGGQNSAYDATAPSLPERDEGQGLFRLIGLAGRLADFQETAPALKTVNSRVKRGLVRKQACPEDGRGQEAVLTDAGMSALVAAAPRHLTTVRESFIDHLEPEELAVIGRVFAKIRKA
jgi:hypothetical protein